MATLLALALTPGCKTKEPEFQPDESPAQRAAASDTSATTNAPLPGPDRPEPTCADLAPLPSRYPAAERVVAIGDLHGDLAATRAVLQLAGAIDESDRWIGGALVVVQTGDILDRGDGEQAILDLLDDVSQQAAAAGGALHVLNGNHELMNAAGDFRYATPGGLADFADVPDLDVTAPDVARLPADHRARAAAFLPGGPYAELLANHNTIVMVGDSVFVHGGVLPAHADRGLESINREIRCWLRDGGNPPASVTDRESPVWTRRYSKPPESCGELQRALKRLGAARMIVGHTTQPTGITSMCNDRVWRIDVGLGSLYGGPIQALELRRANQEHTDTAARSTDSAPEPPRSSLHVRVLTGNRPAPPAP